MAGTGDGSSVVRSYVVFREVEPGLWYLVASVDHQPGLAARAERVQAVRDATGADPAGAVYAALQRDQWQLVHYG